MTADRERTLLSPEEEEFVDRLAAHYAPPSMSPTQRIAFDRALEERLARRVRVSFLRPTAFVATACAALLIWFIAPYRGVQAPNELEQPGTVSVAKESSPSSTSGDNLLTYAYYDREFYGDEDEEEGEDFLPDDYEALVSAFALPDA